MSLRAVYTDLDGTLLGKRGSLFADHEGNFSLSQAKALQACHRAGVEVVIMSGRREAQVVSDSRLMGQSSFVYETGCAVGIEGERFYLVEGPWATEGDRLPAQKMLDAGIDKLMFEHFGPVLEWHEPWHHGREFSLLMRGLVDVDEANALLVDNGHTGLRMLDNGVIQRPVAAVDGPAHVYHLVPEGTSKARGVDFHRRARGYEIEEVIGIGDSVEDLEAAVAVNHFFIVGNGPEHDPAVREALPKFPNASVTEGRMGDGFYEAVVSTLAST